MNAIKLIAAIFVALSSLSVFSQEESAISADSTKQDSVLWADFNRLRETIFALAPGVRDAAANYHVVFSARFSSREDNLPVYESIALIVNLKKQQPCRGRGLCTNLKRMDYSVSNPKYLSAFHRFGTGNGNFPRVFYYGDKYVVVEQYHPGITHGELVISGYNQVWFLEKVFVE